jgi:hypothetical protein
MLFEEEIEARPLPPGGTVTFIPNHLAKAIIGLSISLMTGIYGVVQLARHQNDLLLDAVDERELLTKEES